MAKSGLSAEYLWQKERRKTAVDFQSTAVSGYGPEGKHSLWLPSTESKSSVVFRDGKPTIESKSDGSVNAEIESYRQRIIKSYSGVVAGTVAYIPVDILLFDYSAMLIRMAYDVTDDDLTFLHSSLKWVEQISIHVLGGKDIRDKLAQTRMQDEFRRRPVVIVEGDSGPVAIDADLSIDPVEPPEFREPAQSFDLGSD